MPRYHEPQDAPHLWMTVEDYLSEQLEELARPGSDQVPVLPPAERAVLVARLRALSAEQCAELLTACDRYWADTADEHASAELGIPTRSQRVRLIDAGFALVE